MKTSNKKEVTTVSKAVVKEIEGLKLAHRSFKANLKTVVIETFKLFCNDNGINSKDMQSGNRYRKHVLPLIACAMECTLKNAQNIVALLKVLPCGRPQQAKAKAKAKASTGKTKEKTITFSFKGKESELGSWFVKQSLFSKAFLSAVFQTLQEESVRAQIKALKIA
jgi:hypothetical protein